MRYILLTAAVVLSACGGGSAEPAAQPFPLRETPPPAPAPAPATSGLAFESRAVEAGLAHSHAFTDDYTAMPSLFAGGVAVGDVNGDGNEDLFVVRGNAGANLLLENTGAGFVRKPSALDLPAGSANLRLSGPVFADMDGDGALDLFVGGLGGDPSLVFKGDGAGGFSDVTVGSGLDAMTSANTLSAAFGDVDGDGDLDLAMAHWGTPRSSDAPGETETLWRNDSTADAIVFTPVSEAAGIALNLSADGKLGAGHDYSFVPNFADIDADGRLDLLLVSDFRTSKVFRNLGGLRFEDITDPSRITDANGMGTDVGDVDNSGTPDWFVSSINGNRLYTNLGGTLGDDGRRGTEAGSWGWGSCMADFDLDGDLDIFQTNGWVENAGSPESEPYTADRSRLWLNDGAGVFTDEARALGISDEQQGRAVVCADFDGDLDADILLTVNGGEAIYWENTIPGANAVAVALDGPAGNAAGIGAKVTLTTSGGTQHRWVRVGSTFTAQTSAIPLFGLGGAEVASEIVVDWPDGTQSRVSDVAAGQRVTVAYPN